MRKNLSELLQVRVTQDIVADVRNMSMRLGVRKADVMRMSLAIGLKSLAQQTNDKRMGATNERA